jgi:predicted ATPase/transcriptional regulator with XRE-family HTH domain
VTGQAEVGFGGLLRQLRDDAGLTQDELAEAAQVSQRAVSDLERGINRTARKDTAVLLAGALGLDGRAGDLFVAAARGRVPVTEVLTATSGVDVPVSGGRLPAPVAGFVGRESELAELGRLAARYRLVTITGPGGVGKTRLAIEVAAARRTEHRDGVRFADLAVLPDPAGVAGAVADALGIRQVAGQPASQLLAERVAGMQALLVVDNCEHLVTSVAPIIERVLEAGAGLRVIATSRQPLRVPGERVWQTPPICFPAGPDHGDPAELARFDAVRLFIDRAGRLDAAEETSPGDLRVIGEITALLEGLPLAIELAAARASQLGLHRLVATLDDRLGGSWLQSRTGRARHQTLAATIGWSYDLLTPELQSALKRLAVFTGGSTLEAAATVTGDAGTSADTIAALGERSLIDADRSTSPGQPGRPKIRYRMLELIWQYCTAEAAADDGPGAEAAARDAHSRYFADLARQASAALTGWHQGQRLTTLEADHANLIAAISHLLNQPGRAAEALQMIVHLERFWHYRGHLAEAAALLQRGLNTAGQNISPALRCAALDLVGHATADHDLQTAHSFVTESLRIARAARDDYQAAKALEGVANMSLHTGNPDEGSAAGRKAVQLARTVGDPVLLGDCLIACGNVADDPQERSKAIFQEALAVTRRSGDRVTTGWAHNSLGLCDLAAEDLQAARQHFAQAHAILDEVGDPTSIPKINLGWVHLRSGDTSAASAAFTEALRRFELVPARHAASYATLGLACTAAAQHDWKRAARLLGFADAELQRCGSGSWEELEQTYREQALADTQNQLGTSFDHCYDSGRAGERSDFIDLALRR